MTRNLLIISLCAVPGVAAFVELFLLLPVTKATRRIMHASKKSVSVMKSPKISDYWKQKAMLIYSRRIMAGTLAVLVYLVVVFAGFLGGYFLFGALFLGGLQKTARTLYQWPTHGIILFLGIVYAFLRTRLTRQKEKNRADYSFSSRLFHHLALDSSILKEMAFDMDCVMAKSRTERIRVRAPVYVAGLARSGTTVLLEALYATGVFASLTYRDMPLVCAPYLWSRLTRNLRARDTEKKERAHGDKVFVNYDSPESFEEVFWMTFSNRAYVKPDHLEAHEVDGGLADKYRQYVSHILARHPDPRNLRYLAKNNNNIVRIKALASLFDDAVFIVPFRHPLHHAGSLHLQHRRFVERHARDPFSRHYMNWLGHFEFGTDLKPFKFSGDALPLDKDEPMGLTYWIRYWKSVYEYLLGTHASRVLFFSYDKMCLDPEKCLGNLEQKASLPKGSLVGYAANIRPSARHVGKEEEKALPEPVRELYQALLTASV